MARIAFVLDHEEGHLIPTIALARQLVRRGHFVCYLALHDSVEFVRRLGFECLPILGGVFPPGALARLRDELERASHAEAAGNPVASRAALYDRYLGQMASGDGLDEAVARARPELFIANSLLGLNALVLHFRYGLPIMLISPILLRASRARQAEALSAVLMLMRRGLGPLLELVKTRAPSLRRLEEVTSPLAGFPELIQCPAALTVPGFDPEPEENVFHIEAGVSALEDSDAGSFPWDRLDPSRPLVYCSLGSQSHLAGRDVVRRFLRAVAEGAARRPAWQLVCSTGQRVDPQDLAGALPADAIALPWTPQRALLRRAAVMITHGGLGALKESIVAGVPVAVFPIGRDQPDNAARVVHHRLGSGGDLRTAGADEIWGQVESLHTDPAFRRGVQRMRDEFLAVEHLQLGAQHVEAVLQARPLRA